MDVVTISIGISNIIYIYDRWFYCESCRRDAPIAISMTVSFETAPCVLSVSHETFSKFALASLE